jgi:hypothetical protein
MNIRQFCLCSALVIAARPALAEGLTPAIQARIDERLTLITTWAADPIVVEAVRAHNAAVPAEQLALTQDKWHALTVLDPVVRAFARNTLGQFLKSKKDEFVTEAFVSDAAGLKVGFIAKTTNWSHHGKPKHEVPMAGKNWQGAVEVDESSGQQQLQVSVPVLDGGKPIGSLVVGLSVTKLAE